MATDQERDGRPDRERTPGDSSAVFDEISRRADAGAWLVIGAADSGKSWLARHLLAAAGPGAGERPVHLIEWPSVEGDHRSLGDLIPDDLSDDGIEGLAAALAGRMVIIDDAHRAGDAAASELAGIAERARTQRIQLIVCSRPVAPSAAQRVLVECAEVRRLEPLLPDRPAWRELAGDEPPESLVAATRGWPGLLQASMDDSTRLRVHEVIAARFGCLDSSEQIVAGALAFGARMNDGSLAAVVEANGVSGSDADAAIESLVQGGVLHTTDSMVPLVAESVRRCVAPGRRRALLASLVEHLDPRSAVDLATWTEELGEVAPIIAEICDAAALAVPPEARVDLLDRGYAAAPAPGRGAALAQALLGIGEIDRALALAVREQVPSDVTAVVLARAARIDDACALLDIEPSASPPDTSSAEDPLGGDSASSAQTAATSAIVAALGGRADAVDRVAAISGQHIVGPIAARIALAEGTVAWLAGDPALAERVGRARRLVDDGVDVGQWPFDPMTAHVVATATAALAEPVAPANAERNADEHTTTPVGPFDAERAAVGAWVALRSGRTGDARDSLDSCRSSTHGGAASVMVDVVDAGLALRADDVGRLTNVLELAAPRLGSVAPDAWTAAVFADLVPAAARARHRVDGLLAHLDRWESLAGPASPLRLAVGIAHLVAGVISDDDTEVIARAESISALEGSSAAHVLWRDAAAVFASVHAGSVDVDAVLSLAARLSDAGFVYEASRLTGAGALRVDDAAAAKALLKESRALRAERRGVGLRSGGVAGEAVIELSDREIEVARLVVAGHTHKQVGAELFISAKTVEHHVARIRTKLGVSGRAEMLAALRNYLG